MPPFFIRLHYPLSRARERAGVRVFAPSPITHLTASTPLAPTLSPQGEREQNLKPQRDLSFLWQGIMPPVLGFGLLVLLWMGVSITSKGSIPSPSATFAQAITIFSDPFYSKGPND